MKKVFVLGLDGATFDLINPWVKEGKLPHIAGLMKEGVSGDLTSTVPDHSAPAWSTFITGKNPGKHGIFYFSEHVQKNYQVRFINASMRDGPSLWKIISDANGKVGILNVPMTYPPQKVNGFMIAGMDSPGPESGFTYPQDIYQELQTNIGKYIIEPGLWSFISKGQIDESIRKQKEAVKQRFTAMRYLMDHYPWDFFMTVFTATDRAQHVFWKYMDPQHPLYNTTFKQKYGSHILSIYQDMDEIIHYLLKKLGDETLFMIMSDHGAGPCSAKSFYLNNWLREKGLLAYKDSFEPGALKISSRFKNALYTNWLGRLPRRAWRALAREKKEFIKKVIPGLRDFAASHYYFSRIDMGKSKAYAEESKTFIWINKKVGNSTGMVSPGKEYEGLRDFIISELHDLKCPETHEPIIERAYRKEEIYHGRNLDKAPDVVVTFRPRGYVPRPSYSVGSNVILKTLQRENLEKNEFNLRENARHQINGILMMRGKMLKRGYSVKRAHIMDLAPTILYAMGLPIPDDMDGKVLADVFDTSLLKENPIAYCDCKKAATEKEVPTPYSEEQEREVKDRLKDLGYL